MKRVILFCWLLLAAVALHGQKVDRAQLEAYGTKGDAYFLQGNLPKALEFYSKKADGYRAGGNAYILEEIDAIFSMNAVKETVVEKKGLLEQMEQRLAAVRPSENSAVLHAYAALLKSEILRLENQPRESRQVMLDALQALPPKEKDDKLGRKVRMLLYVDLGANAFESGALNDAISYYVQGDEVFGTPETPIDKLYIAINEMNLGVAYRSLGEPALAEDHYQNSLVLFEAIHGEESPYYPYLLSNLSALYGQRGMYADALDYGEKALEKTSKNAPGRTPMLIQCATSYCETGQFPEAEKMLQEAAEQMERFGATEQWINLYDRTLMALYYLTGRLKESIAVGERMQRRMKQQASFSPDESSQIYQMMSYHASMLNNWEDALQYMLSAMEVFEKAYGDENDKYMSMLYRCGRILNDMGEEEKGKQIQQVALTWLENRYGADSPYVLSLLGSRPGSVTYDIKTLTEGMKADMAAGRYNEALAKMDECIRLYKQSGKGGVEYLVNLSMRNLIFSLKGDASGLAAGLEEYNDELRRDMRVNLSYMTEDERERYYASVIPSVFYAYMTEFDPSVAGPIYNALLLRKGFLLGAGIGLERLIEDSGDASLQQTLTEMKGLRSGPVEDANLPARERFAAKSRADSLENVLLRKSHDYGDFLSLADISWEDVRSALRPDEIAVEFIQGGSERIPVYCLMLLRKDWKQPRNIVLYSDEDHLIEKVSDPDYADAVYSLPDMYNTFWKPLEKYVKPGDKIYFAMDGFLNAFAFEHFQSDEGDYAMDRFELHRVSSTRELIGRKAAAPERSAALFGGFDYNLSGEEVSYYASMTRSGSSEDDWGYLPGTLDEVETADSILEGKVDVALYTGEEGLESRFKALSGQAPDLLHVATHGYYVEGDDDPMDRSGLVFSGANSLREEGPAESGEDGLLKSSEIALLDLRGTDLIVLSACQSGIGSISSDGVYGLQRAFKKAGVHSILMSLWKVNDQVTAEMMRLFYTGLAAGKDSRAAFQAARETLRKTYSDPLLWAPFVLLES